MLTDADAIESQASVLYSPEQVQAWAALAWLPGVLDRTLMDGVGWISGSDDAFALRYPQNRLALLYCRGRVARQGHARALLDQIEQDARFEGITAIRTEASKLSRPLLHRRGWRVVAPEMIKIVPIRTPILACFAFVPSSDSKQLIAWKA